MQWPGPWPPSMWRPSTASTSAAPPCWPCGLLWSSSGSAPTTYSSTASTPSTGPVPSSRSSRATQSASPSPPPACSPKSTATACWSSLIAGSPATAWPATRATAQLNTWPLLPVSAPRRCTARASIPWHKLSCDSNDPFSPSHKSGGHTQWSFPKSSRGRPYPAPLPPTQNRPCQQQYRQHQRQSHGAEHTRLHLPPVMNHAAQRGEINKLVQPVPVLSAQLADRPVGRRQRQRHQQQPRRHANGDELPLGNIVKHRLHIEASVERYIRQQVQGSIEEREQPQQPAKFDQPTQLRH